MAATTLKVVFGPTVGVNALAASAGAETSLAFDLDGIDPASLVSASIGAFANGVVFYAKASASGLGGTVYANNTLANTRTGFGIGTAS
jgi:hypothetical protein